MFNSYCPYVALSSKQETLMYGIIKLYKKNENDPSKFTSEFLKNYMPDNAAPLNDQIVKDNIHFLVNAGYLSDEATIFPTDLALNYHFWMFIHWKDRFIVPLSVSIIGSILANMVIFLFKK